VSLVRPEGATDQNGPAVAFGAGPHMCTGRPFALLLSELAGQIHGRLEPGRVRDAPLTVKGDGSFLCITEPAAPPGR
jgi:hypothetical protein